MKSCEKEWHVRFNASKAGEGQLRLRGQAAVSAIVDLLDKAKQWAKKPQKRQRASFVQKEWDAAQNSHSDREFQLVEVSENDASFFFERPQEIAFFAAELMKGVYAIADGCDAMTDCGKIDAAKIPQADKHVLAVGLEVADLVGLEVADLLAKIIFQAIESAHENGAG